MEVEKENQNGNEMEMDCRVQLESKNLIVQEPQLRSLQKMNFGITNQ